MTITTDLVSKINKNSRAYDEVGTIQCESMFPNEIAILMAVEEAGELTMQQLAHVTDVVGVSSRHLCNSLISRGYLIRTSARGYSNTFKGKKVILDTNNEGGNIDGTLEAQKLSPMCG